MQCENAETAETAENTDLNITLDVRKYMLVQKERWNG